MLEVRFTLHLQAWLLRQAAAHCFYYNRSTCHRANAGVWIWPSITQNAYQTAEIVAYKLAVGRNRIVPEYSFLDKRGVGALENVPLDKAEDAAHSGDELNVNWRPEKGAPAGATCG